MAVEYLKVLPGDHIVRRRAGQYAYLASDGQWVPFEKKPGDFESGVVPVYPMASKPGQFTHKRPPGYAPEEEPLHELMGEENAVRYAQACDSATLYGRKLKDMSKLDLQAGGGHAAGAARASAQRLTLLNAVEHVLVHVEPGVSRVALVLLASRLRDGLGFADPTLRAHNHRAGARAYDLSGAASKGQSECEGGEAHRVLLLRVVTAP